MAALRSKSDPGGLLDDIAFLPMEAVGDRGDFERGSVKSRREIGTGYTYFEDGDVLRAKVTPCFENGKGAVVSGLAGGCGFGSTELVALRPRAGVDPRFLYYLLMSEEFTSQGAAHLYGAHGVKRVPEKCFRDFVAWSPPEQTQRAIADYLDRETARIDALVDKTERLVALIAERAARAFVDAVERRGTSFPVDLESIWPKERLPSGWLVMHLSRALVQLTNGYVGPTRDILVDEGIPYIQSLHIKRGRIDFERKPFFVEPGWHYQRPRIHLRTGDVLIVQTGDIGQVALVPEGFGEASCHALQIARVRRELITGEYLGAYLRSPYGNQSLLCRATGALHPHLEAGIKDIPVLIPPLSVQKEIVAEVRRDQVRDEAAKEALTREITLFHERRSALITAAVTGQLDIPKAA